MPAWFERFRKAQWRRQETYLERSLKKFDPYDFEILVNPFLDANPEILEAWAEAEGEDPQDLLFDRGYEWLEYATTHGLADELQQFEEYANDHGHDYTTEVGPRVQMDFLGRFGPDWMVHFTNDAEAISGMGFTSGHPDLAGLSLTTNKSEQARKREAGYNFAFEVDTRDARYAARQGKYGKEAVVFFGTGIKTVHYGDEEEQIVFWGPSIPINMIFPIYRERYSEEGWYVPNFLGRAVYGSEDKGEQEPTRTFEECVDWVIGHWRELNDTRGFEERRPWGRKRRKEWLDVSRY